MISKKDFLNASLLDRNKHLAEIANEMIDEFELLAFQNLSIEFNHKQTGLPFQLILGGEYLMGLSDKEEMTALNLSDPLPFDSSYLKPAHIVKINPFLISKTPIQNGQLAKILDWHYPEDDVFNPANVTYDIIKKVSTATSMTLPSEEEWEYTCRADTNTLFVFGDTIPEDDELFTWLNCDFSNLDLLKANSFGMYGLFAGEWCSNNFKENYSDNAITHDQKTIRGGGSLFYPWQDQEWIWCMSSMRMSAEEMGDEKIAAFRLIKRLV